MNNLLVALCASAFTLGSVVALADDDKYKTAYKMGMAWQKFQDNLPEAKGCQNPPNATPEESKAIKDAAANARAAYAGMTPEEKTMYRRGMSEQSRLDQPKRPSKWTTEFAHCMDKEGSTKKP